MAVGLETGIYCRAREQQQSTQRRPAACTPRSKSSKSEGRLGGKEKQRGSAHFKLVERASNSISRYIVQKAVIYAKQTTIQLITQNSLACTMYTNITKKSYKDKNEHIFSFSVNLKLNDLKL